MFTTLKTAALAGLIGLMAMPAMADSLYLGFGDRQAGRAYMLAARSCEDDVSAFSEVLLAQLAALIDAALERFALADLVEPYVNASESARCLD